MCVTDLDLEPEITEDEQAPGPQTAGGQAPGVAWGLADRPGDPAAGDPPAGDPPAGDPAAR